VCGNHTLRNYKRIDNIFCTSAFNTGIYKVRVLATGQFHEQHLEDELDDDRSFFGIATRELNRGELGMPRVDVPQESSSIDPG